MADTVALTSRPFASRLRVRSVFISDVHLGTRECHANALLEFLGAVDAEQIFLVGDIVDLWNMRRSTYWPQSHSEVLRTLFGKARQGCRVIYVPGNHDIDFRPFAGSVLGGFEVRRDCAHVTATGERLWVTHGDQFDGVVQCPGWLTAIGSHAYDVTLVLNRYVNTLRRALGFENWSLVAYLKRKIGNASRYIADFEVAVAREARRQGFDGVICGHIHRPCMTEIDGAKYFNTGDWVESCSMLIEDRNGRLSLTNWPQLRMQLGLDAATIALEQAA